jgi:uncharacterized protein YbjT (DUF2867 family)
LCCGHHVIGTTRSEEKFAVLRALGVDPVAVDVFDAKGLSQVVRSVQPQIIIHQLTDLPTGLEPSRMAEAIVRNARIRDEGTRNLLAAAAAAGARRVVAQSVSRCRARRSAGKLTAKRARGRAGVMAKQEGDGVFATIKAGAAQRQRDVLLRFDGIAH